MRSFFIAAWLLIAPFLAFTQEHIPVIEDYQNFLKSKTMVVLDGVALSEFNGVIEDVVKRAWTITPFEVISSKEFEKLKNDPSLSFLLTSTVTFHKDKTKARYKFLSLLMGESKAEVRTMPDLCSIPLSYLQVESDSYNYKLEAFLLFIQNHVKNVIADEKLIGENALKHYNNKEKGALANKVIYLTKEDLAKDVSTEKAIAAVYPYEFKIVTREEIAEAIASRDPKVVFLHKVGPEGTRIRARVYKLLVGAADSQLYYFNYLMMDNAKDDAFQLNDFKKLK
jgi:hypothetical protein